MNLKKYFYLLMIIGFAINTSYSTERNIDNTCKYITMENGQALTYRNALTLALDTFCNQSQYEPLKTNIQKVLPQAIRLFGQGEQPEDVLKNENFNYTFFKTTIRTFLTELNKINLPIIVNEEGQRYVYNMQLFDIDYALSGILQYHAYQSTGGDS